MFVNGLRGLRVAGFEGLGIVAWRRLSSRHALGAGFRNLGGFEGEWLRVQGLRPSQASTSDKDCVEGFGLTAADSSARTRVEC